MSDSPDSLYDIHRSKMASVSSQPESGLRSPTATDHMDFLRCFLCDRAYTDPKLLPCLHSFCQVCLSAYMGMAGVAPGHSTDGTVTEPATVTELLLAEAAADHGDLSQSTPSGSDMGNSTDSVEGAPQLPATLTCPMCKTTVTIPNPGGLAGFKDNLLIIEMVRRWEEKLFGDKPKPVCSPDSATVEDGGDVEKCTCLPACKHMTNEKLSSSGGVTNGARTAYPTVYWCDNYGGVSIFLSGVSSTKSASMSRHLDNHAQTQHYCVTCDVMICSTCKDFSHSEHQTKTVAEATSEKKDYLQSLLTDLSHKSNACDTSLKQVENSHQHLLTSTEHIVKEIEERSARLIEIIQSRRNQLIDELSAILKSHEQKLAIVQANLNKERENLTTAAKFACDLLEYGTSLDVMYLNSDVSGRLHELLTDQNNNTVDIANVHLEVSPFWQEEMQIVKAFGSLVQGEVKCGSAALLQSFDLDLKWPTGMATTRNKEFVVTGKMGAFEEKGKVMFFGRSGHLKTTYDLDENCIPYDTTVTGDGTVLVADNTGRIHRFDSSGRKVDTRSGMFKGVGRLAPVQNSWGNFVVTSSDEKKVYVYKDDGELSLVIPNSPPTDDDDGTDSSIRLDHPHYVATNRNNDVIVSDFEQNAVYAFDSGGNFRFRYGGSGVEGGDLKCPSAVCCDNFNNILIADFMNDRVHLVSQSGHFLGYLLTRDDKVSCPNFLSIDGDGHLFVGQYGGLIQAFQYMSYMKFV